MRRHFHFQLKKVWETHPLLVDKQKDPDSILNKEKLAREHSIPPWSFVPLITKKLQVLCALEITLLRLDHPGDSVWSGDIDNRVKTIIDALEIPSSNCQYATDIPFEPEMSPLLCLIDTDKLFTKVSIETDRLLSAPDGADQTWADVILKVRATPENVTMLNIGF